MADSERTREFLANELGHFHHHAERDWFDRAARITAGRSVSLHARFGAERVEVHPDDTANCIDGADARCART
jgi:hypothetical protein